jgi:uncharacterized Tic20 family protein
MRLNGGMTTPANYSTPAMSPEDQRLWSTLVHVGGIFFGFWAPLIGYLVFKDRGDFVRKHSATALNFQITMTLAAIVGAVLTLILVGILVIVAVWALEIILSIMAAIAANNGQPYKYPVAIEFVR